MVVVLGKSRDVLKKFTIDMAEITDNSEILFDLETDITIDELSLQLLPKYPKNSPNLLALWLTESATPCVNLFAREEGKYIPLSSLPTIAILTALHHVPSNVLLQTINSVTTQEYPKWEWHIVVDTGVPLPEEQEGFLKHLVSHTKTFVHVLPKNSGISLAQNAGLDKIEDSDAQWFLTLDHDDMLHPEALLRIAEEVVRNPDAGMSYADENKCDESGAKFFGAFQKPDWSPALLLCQNYICHPCALSCKLSKGLRYDPEYDGAQDHKFLLDWVGRNPLSKVVHIPQVLYHWRVLDTSTASDIGIKPSAAINGARAVYAFLGSKALSVLRHPHSRGGVLRPLLKNKKRSIRIVIPSKDHLDVVSNCLYSLSHTQGFTEDTIRYTQSGMYQIAIVDNGSSDKDKALATYRKHTKGAMLQYGVYPFNFSIQSNKGAEGFGGDYLLFLNNDTEACHPEWLMRMASWLDHFPDVAAVGAKLLYPTGNLQHGGVEVYSNGTGGHPSMGLRYGEAGYFDRLETTHEVSAVTGACMLVRRTVFEEVGGFEEELPGAFNDVDLCLKIRQRGYRILYTPEAVLFHHESLTRGKNNHEEESFRKAVLFMEKKWGGLFSFDPYKF